MLGDFLTRIFVIVLAYMYPAFECYKTVEKNKVEIEQLRFWCQYWIIIATLTVFERFTDTLISWLPMYGEMKLGFIVYLWYPKTKGTSYVYDAFLRPNIARYEKDIDRKILELRARALDIITLYMHSLITYGQTTFFQILQFLAAQSANVRTNTKQKDNSNNTNAPTNTTTPTKQQDKLRSHGSDKMRSPRSTVVHRMVSPPLKTELVQENMPNETVAVAQSVESISTTEEKNNTTTTTQVASNVVKETDIPSSPATPSVQEGGNIAETLRNVRTRLRRSQSRPQD